MSRYFQRETHDSERWDFSLDPFVLVPSRSWFRQSSSPSVRMCWEPFKSRLHPLCEWLMVEFYLWGLLLVWSKGQQMGHKAISFEMEQSIFYSGDQRHEYKSSKWAPWIPSLLHTWLYFQYIAFLTTSLSELSHQDQYAPHVTCNITLKNVSSISRYGRKEQQVERMWIVHPKTCFHSIFSLNNKRSMEEIS